MATQDSLTIPSWGASAPTAGTVRWLWLDPHKRFGRWTWAGGPAAGVAIVAYRDGTVLTTTGWQTGPQPADVAHYDWMEPTTGRRCIMLIGWPRLL